MTTNTKLLTTLLGLVIVGGGVVLSVGWEHGTTPAATVKMSPSPSVHNYPSDSPSPSGTPKPTQTPTKSMQPTAKSIHSNVLAAEATPTPTTPPNITPPPATPKPTPIVIPTVGPSPDPIVHICPAAGKPWCS